MFGVDTLPFIAAPSEDPDAFKPLFVAPDIFPALLDSRSSVVSAAAGCGKTVLAEMASRAMAPNWLCVTYSRPGVPQSDHQALMISLRDATIRRLWEQLKQEPERLRGIGGRREALRFFLNQHLGERLARYELGVLAEDFPALSSEVNQILAIPDEALFNQSTTEVERFSILCGCVGKLGFGGVMILIDGLKEGLEDKPDTENEWLARLFDSLNVIRLPHLRFKCFAPPRLANRLAGTNSLVRNSADYLRLEWSPVSLRDMVDRRINAATRGAVEHLEAIIDFERASSFLVEFSSVSNPAEWLALARIALEEVRAQDDPALSARQWTKVRRRYCAERLPIRRDSAGGFWRGPRPLSDLTARKRAVYSLVEYLYDNPGVQKTYKVAKAIRGNEGARKRDESGPNEGALTTTVSRARDLIEPSLDGLVSAGDEAIYLITDHGSGGGYELVNVER